MYFDPERRVTDDTLTLFRTNAWRPVVEAEVRAARNEVTLLDLPGFSTFEIEGRGATQYLDALICTRLPRVGRIGLVYALTSTGTVLSEFTVTRLGDDHFLVIGAASAEWHDLDVLEAALPAAGDITITNRAHESGTLVLAGPRARDVLAGVTRTPLDNVSFPWLSSRDIDTAVGRVRALRVSYIGELGWELHADNEQLVGLYDLLHAAGDELGLRDIGIYAVDTMRLDKGYRSWKADLEIGFSPLDASLERFVDFDKPDFIGRDALLVERERGPRYRFVTLVLDQPGAADAPANASVFSSDERVGIVTSGGWSFTAGASVALAYIQHTHAHHGATVEIEIFGERVAARISTEAIYDPTNSRLRA